MSLRYVIVKDGKIENVVMWDGTSQWSPPEGSTAHQYDGPASPGWDWQDDAPVHPPEPPPAAEAVAPPTPQEKLAALGLTVEDLKDLLK